MEGFTSLSSCAGLLSLRGFRGAAGGGDVARFPAFVTGSVFKFASVSSDCDWVDHSDSISGSRLSLGCDSRSSLSSNLSF